MKIKTWRIYLIILAGSALLAVLIRTFLISVYFISTDSMAPFLGLGDYIVFVQNKILPVSEPRRGEIVGFYRLGENGSKKVFLRRVVAISGDKIELADGNLILNGQKFQYQVLSQSSELEYNSDGGWAIRGRDQQTTKDSKTQRHFGPLLLGIGEVFVLPDNRTHLGDPQGWGIIKEREIIGHLLIRLRHQ